MIKEAHVGIKLLITKWYWTGCETARNNLYVKCYRSDTHFHCNCWFM